MGTSESRPKQNRRPESRKPSKDPPFGFLGVLNFLRQYETFRKFPNVSKQSALKFFCNKLDFQKGQRVALITIFSIFQYEYFSQSTSTLYPNFVF